MTHDKSVTYALAVDAKQRIAQYEKLSGKSGSGFIAELGECRTLKDIADVTSKVDREINLIKGDRRIDITAGIIVAFAIAAPIALHFAFK